MKFITYKDNETSGIKLGLILNNNVLDLNKESKGKLPSVMLTFLEGEQESLKIAEELSKKTNLENLQPLNKIKLLAPILNPPSLKDAFAFEDHAKAGSERAGNTLSEYWYEIPAYYKGNHREIYGPEDEIPWPSYTKKLDFECEIACVIGKKGRNITQEEAKEYIFGYMIFNDVSARDIQKKEMALRLGPCKGKDFANVFGPYLVTKDEVNPKKDFTLKVKINNELWSEGHFNDMYWDFPTIISHISQEETIYPGDIIGSGTFYKGCGLDLNKWVKPGDIIELEVNKLGVLRNKIGNPKMQKELVYSGTNSKTR